MDDVTVSVFQQTKDHAQVRFAVGSQVHTRGLAGDDLEALIGRVEQEYDRDAAGPRVFGSATLGELGEDLYEFLDGDQRWLSGLAAPDGAIVRIDTATERLRHLPWELIARDKAHLAVSAASPVLPVRACRMTATQPGTVGNRPLRVLFMATSPEGVEPELSYEAEEAAILAATADTGIELVVEESGTLDGLKFTAQSYGAGYFDVLHLSGHANVVDGQSEFLVEDEFGLARRDEQGRPRGATAEQIAAAMAGQWPRVVFPSGCLTANAPGGGVFPSMSESLVGAGAPTVLGWALPVGDVSATRFAAELYAALAKGRRLDHALITARRALYQDKSANWHLLRVYADAAPLAELVTPLHTPGRGHVQLRAAADVFLDPSTQLTRVAGRAEFVGRRRLMQRCLRALTRPHGADGATEALVLAGMGGLGKSSVASRLLERMPTHRRVVGYGRIDLIAFRGMIANLDFPTYELRTEAIKLLDGDDDLPGRLRYLFKGPLATTPCLFVFDDFEQGNLEDRDGGHVLSADMAQLLPALLAATRETNSRSRVIITSRYRFPVPAGSRVRFEALETFSAVEQAKKLVNLPQLHSTSKVDSEIRKRAILAAAGNPRLMEWLDRIIDDSATDVEGLVAAIEGKAAEFREDILARTLLDAQASGLRMMLAAVNVIELPVPAATVRAVAPGPETATHMQRATDLGLLEAGTDPETGEARYFVSNVLRSLLRPLLTDDEYTKACAAAARSLFQEWVDPSDLPDGSEGAGS